MRYLPWLFATAALLAAACGPSEPTVEVARYSGEPNGDDVAMIGALVIENKCLYVRLETGEDVLTAFPSAFTRWDNNRQVLVLGGRDIPLGEMFVFGGSGHPLANLTDVRWSTPPHRACAAGKPYVWLSQEAAASLSERPQFRTASSRGTPFPDPTPWHSLTYREALEKDAATYAREHNVSLAEAIAVLEAQLGLVSTPTPHP